MQFYQLSSTATAYINSLSNVSTSNFNSAISDIIAIEEDIITNDFDDKNICLITASVLRNSYTYWYNELNDTDSDWDNYSSLSWGDIGKADAGGALVGGITGAVGAVTSGALVFGPGGVVLVAAGGAVVGSLKASAAAGAVGAFLSIFD